MAKREVKFESQDRRIAQINKVLNSYGIASIEEAEAICDAKGIDPYLECEQTQNICFENAKWAYVVGAAIAIKKNCIHAADAAEAIGEGLQAFCIPGSVADDRKVGLGHGNLAARLLREETQCFAFLAGHESFAAAEGAIKIAEMANKVRKNPLRVILNGLGKDAAMIISRINGFTYVQTEFDYYTGELKVVKTKAYSDGPRAKVNCYGADDVREGVVTFKLAAHAADIAKGHPAAIKRDLTMSRARYAFNWRDQFNLSLDPDRAAEYHREMMNGEDADFCSMCGPSFCAMKITKSIK